MGSALSYIKWQCSFAVTENLKYMFVQSMCKIIKGVQDKMYGRLCDSFDQF